MSAATTASVGSLCGLLHAARHAAMQAAAASCCCNMQHAGGHGQQQHDATPRAATRTRRLLHTGSTTISSSSSRPAAAVPSRRPIVAVAVSGGVDSAVAALLTRRAGHEAFGVFMHNWDAGDEAGGGGGGACTSERDLRDAKAVCERLRMPLLEADFVGRYWGDVFSGFLAGVGAGLTPNPDLTCNAAIKFGALWEFARAAGADAIATGHYARLGRYAGSDGSSSDRSMNSSSSSSSVSSGSGSSGAGAVVQPLGPFECWSGEEGASGSSSAPLLLRGADASKDQSYFLAGVSGQQLAHAVFPVGG